jgi:hypothetical protein
MKRRSDYLRNQFLRLITAALACGLSACMNARQLDAPPEYTSLPPGCDIGWSTTGGFHPGSITCSSPTEESQTAWRAAAAKCGGPVLRLTAAKGDLAAHYKCQEPKAP